MRLSQLLYLPLLASAALAQEAPAGERFEYQVCRSLASVEINAWVASPLSPSRIALSILG